MVIVSLEGTGCCLKDLEGKEIKELSIDTYVLDHGWSGSL